MDRAEVRAHTVQAVRLCPSVHQRAAHHNLRACALLAGPSTLTVPVCANLEGASQHARCVAEQAWWRKGQQAQLIDVVVHLAGLELLLDCRSFLLIKGHGIHDLLFCRPLLTLLLQAEHVYGQTGHMYGAWMRMQARWMLLRRHAPSKPQHDTLDQG